MLPYVFLGFLAIAAGITVLVTLQEMESRQKQAPHRGRKPKSRSSKRCDRCHKSACHEFKCESLCSVCYWDAKDETACRSLRNRSDISYSSDSLKKATSRVNKCDCHGKYPCNYCCQGKIAKSTSGPLQNGSDDENRYSSSPLQNKSSDENNTSSASHQNGSINNKISTSSLKKNASSASHQNGSDGDNENSSSSLNKKSSVKNNTSSASNQNGSDGDNENSSSSLIKKSSVENNASVASFQNGSDGDKENSSSPVKNESNGENNTAIDSHQNGSNEFQCCVICISTQGKKFVCEHYTMCDSCVAYLMENDKNCPDCRKPIQRYL